MSRELTQLAQTSVAQKNISAEYILTINGVNYSSYVISYSFSFNKDFGSASCMIEMHNPNGLFGSVGANRLYVGDEISLILSF